MAKSLAAELRDGGWSEGVIATATVCGKPLAEYERTSKRSDLWAGYKSTWEMLYSMELEDLKRVGIVRAWQYEPMRLRLTDPNRDVDGKAVRPIFYTPDFLVDRVTYGRLCLVEIKGYRRTKDVNRFKLARDKFPYFEFVMLSYKAGGWEIIM